MTTVFSQTNQTGAKSSLAGTTDRAQAAYKAVRDWDLGTIAKYCVDAGIYTQDEIGAVMDEYARYIALATTFGQVDWVPISKKLDDFWHTHILFTEDYALMCATVCGRFIHHRPRILDDDTKLEGKFAMRTLELYKKHFGEPNVLYWGGAMCTCQIAD